MGQVAPPVADDFDSGWTPTPVYAQVDGSSMFHATFVSSSAQPQGDTFQVQLKPLAKPDPTAPPSATALFVVARDTNAGSSSSSSSAPGSGPVTIVLLKGDSTIIAVRNVQPTGGFANAFEPPLTAAEISLIGDYSDLHVRVIAGNPVVGCCPNRLPAVLYATVANKTGDCTCLPDSFPMVWDGRQSWVGPGPMCGARVETNFFLQCNGNSCDGFQLFNTYFGVGFAAPQAGCTCRPLSLVFNLTFVHGCSGSATLTITE